MTDPHEMVYYEARLKDRSFSKQQIKNTQMSYQECLQNVKIAGRDRYKKAGPFLTLLFPPAVRTVFTCYLSLLRS